MCMQVFLTHAYVCSILQIHTVHACYMNTYFCMCMYVLLSVFCPLHSQNTIIQISVLSSPNKTGGDNVIQAATIMNDRVLMVLSGSFPTGNQFGKSREVLGTFTMAVPIVWSNGSCTAKLTTCSMLWKHQRWLNQCYCQAPHVHSCVSAHVL